MTPADVIALMLGAAKAHQADVVSPQAGVRSTRESVLRVSDDGGGSLVNPDRTAVCATGGSP